MKAATTSRFHSEISDASRQRSVRRRSMSSSSRSIREGWLAMANKVEIASDGLGFRRSDGLGFRRGRDPDRPGRPARGGERKSTRLNSSHVRISYAVFCLKKKKK